MSKLHCLLVQPDLHWQDPPANLEHLSRLISAAATPFDLVVLPEMFTSGFTQQPEPLYGSQTTIQWMCDQAQQYNSAIVGSLACEVLAADGVTRQYVNRLLFVTPEGVLAHYDKCHLFQMAGEHRRYQAGHKQCIVEFRGWRILLTVCYDLRFPVFCRNQQNYDMMLCVANWPDTRRHAWRTLLQARAIENQAYIVGVNRVGIDGNQLSYQGDSMVVDMDGQLLVDGGDGKEGVLSATICFDDLQRRRQQFPVWQDADAFTLIK